jgi:hypothetical protein
MGRFINESVQQVMEQILGGKLRIHHYSDFATTVMRHGFQAAERFGLKNDIIPIEKAKAQSSFKSGTIHIQWHGKHISTNGTTMAAQYGIMYSYLTDHINAPWVALCLAKMAQEGRTLIKAGYLNPRTIDLAAAREEYWTWIAGHFGSTSPIPTAKSDPDLFAKILDEKGSDEPEPVKVAVKTSPYNKEQNEAIARLKLAGVDFKPQDEPVAIKATPQILADMEVVSKAGILDYMEDEGLAHYQVNKGVALEQSVAIITPMKISANPLITESNANGAVFTKSGRSVTWVHGAVLADGKFLGNAGTIAKAQEIAREVLSATSINEAITARAAKVASEHAITG